MTIIHRNGLPYGVIELGKGKPKGKGNHKKPKRLQRMVALSGRNLEELRDLFCKTPIELRDALAREIFGPPKQDRRSFRKGLYGKCEICDLEAKMNRDHCHRTGLDRGSLCISCNAGLGMFKDRVDLLQRATSYLKKFESALTLLKEDSSKIDVLNSILTYRNRLPKKGTLAEKRRLALKQEIEEVSRELKNTYSKMTRHSF